MQQVRMKTDAYGGGPGELSLGSGF